MMNKKNVLKVLGYVATMIGLGATLMTEWVKDQELDEKIEEKINEALAEKKEEEEDDEYEVEDTEIEEF